MGDTGSLSLGAALGTLAILLKKEILLIIIGGVFVVESISVIMQIFYFKITKKKYGVGKRLFKMSPIHHHLELSGWPETHIVIRLWIIGIILALFSLTTFLLSAIVFLLLKIIICEARPHADMLPLQQRLTSGILRRFIFIFSYISKFQSKIIQ